ncbi:MAG: LacI family transcriptional regulator [Verrucomicrobia bacterium]|nr:MAG: LacI family transcriptional regulator [Verrucomicrobiota bacterium]
MIRLKDIALRAGVSIMTVSKALRNAPDVSDATRARIKVLAQQLGYVPDPGAQSLRTRTTKLFGLVIPTITNPVFTRIVAALEEQAHQAGYDTLLAHTDNTPAREETVIRRLLARRVDGLFVAPAYRMESEARIYHELKARGTPVVLLGQPAPFCSQFPFVSPDDLVGGYHAAQHLLKLGHRRIAFLSGKLVAPWAHLRFEGYRRALREFGLEVDDKFVFNAGSTIEDGAKAGLQFLDEKCKATAIQAVNDLVAVGCAEALLKQGLKIPDDISIIGFGNVLMAEHFRVPLSTMRQAKARLGDVAFDLMSRLLRRESVDSRLMPAELTVRASTAAPRG